MGFVCGDGTFSRLRNYRVYTPHHPRLRILRDFRDSLHEIIERSGAPRANPDIRIKDDRVGSQTNSAQSKNFKCRKHTARKPLEHLFLHSRAYRQPSVLPLPSNSHGGNRNSNAFLHPLAQKAAFVASSACVARPGGGFYFMLKIIGLSAKVFVLFPGSSVVERLAVNEMVVGSNPTRGAVEWY